jgi:hypothetical protein
VNLDSSEIKKQEVDPERNYKNATSVNQIMPTPKTQKKKKARFNSQVASSTKLPQPSYETPRLNIQLA